MLGNSHNIILVNFREENLQKMGQMEIKVNDRIRNKLTFGLRVTGRQYQPTRTLGWLNERFLFFEIAVCGQLFSLDQNWTDAEKKHEKNEC